MIKIKRFKSSTWFKETALIFQRSIENILVTQDKCTVMLTGGTTAKKLYDAWKDHPNFQSLRNVTFFLSDERCVNPSNSYSNFKMVMESLFVNGIPAGCQFHRMQGEHPNLEFEGERYGDLLPDALDFLLLSIGNDCHIASIYPNSKVLNEMKKKVMSAAGGVPIYNRLTITPKVIINARQIFVLAIGRSKEMALYAAINDDLDMRKLPARLAFGGVWFLIE